MLTLRTTVRRVMDRPPQPEAIQQTSLFRGVGLDPSMCDHADIEDLAILLDLAEFDSGTKTRPCYVEMIDRLGTETKWRRTFPDVASACSFARCARKPDEFIRIIPPCGLTADQRKELDDLGVIPTEQFVPPPRSEQLPIGEKGPELKMSVFDDFEAAWVDHVVFGRGNARLAAARARMKASPDYDDHKYLQALFSAERTAEVFSRHMRVSN